MSRAGMARTSWWMCVLNRAQKIKSAVGGCGGEADVETHYVRYSWIKRYWYFCYLIHVCPFA